MRSLLRILKPAGFVIGAVLYGFAVFGAFKSLEIWGFDSTQILVFVSAVLLVSLVAVIWVQQQTISQLESANASDDAKDECKRKLVALQRNFMKKKLWLNSPQGGAAPPALLHDLTQRLRDAQQAIKPISVENAGEFGDLADILDKLEDSRRSVVAQHQRDGDSIFDRAIEQMTR